MKLKKMLDVNPHIEKALYFSGIAITTFAVLPLLEDWTVSLAKIVIFGLLFLAFCQLILSISFFFEKT